MRCNLPVLLKAHIGKGLKLLLLLGLSLKVLANGINPTLFFPSTANSLVPSPSWLTHKKPLPTSTWFINFLLSDDKKPSYPVTIFPYMAQISLDGLSLSYSTPFFYKDPKYPDIISSIYYPFKEALNLGTLEKMDTYGLASYHGLKINWLWQNVEQSMTTPLVQGSPFVTAIFSNARPKISSPYALLSINQHSTMGAIPPETRFECVFAVGPNQTQTWIIYTEKPLGLNWDQVGNKTLLTGNRAYTGWLRVILQSDMLSGVDNDLPTLDAYSQTIPLDYQQNYYDKNDAYAYSLTWLTQNGQPPLMLSLPHQRQSNNVVAEQVQPKVSYRGIKGLMLGETSARWEITLPRVPIVFLESKSYSKTQKRDLLNALKTDLNELLSRPFPDDSPYQVGKRLTRAARLLLIADAMGEHRLRDSGISFLQNYLNKKMQNQGAWHFQYDNTWGGIIPSMDDYGARHYNDHHYHYGYWVYAIAVLGKFDPTWLKQTIAGTTYSPKDWTDILIRDYANKEKYDPYFPAQRYQDDYAGHSWASGLSAFQDGQNQQSSSEAVHAYYAMALYAETILDANLYRWAAFLMARELKAAQMYWQVQKTNTIYSEAFKASNAVVANLWDSKVDSNAFFVRCETKYRCGLEYSFGIEMLPFTAITGSLLNPEWLKTAYPTIMKLINQQFGEVTPAWQWILIKGLASILTLEEKKHFFSKAVDSKPKEYDNGDSKTNTLYFLMND